MADFSCPKNCEPLTTKLISRKGQLTITDAFKVESEPLEGDQKGFTKLTVTHSVQAWMEWVYVYLLNCGEDEF